MCWSSITYKHLQTIILQLLRSCYAKREFKCYYVNCVDKKNDWRGFGYLKPLPPDVIATAKPKTVTYCDIQ